ncbi:hypothetical protein AB0I16_04385 [Streptomyces sp. NPDC050703]|uniref:hypothetical protein n=1 Tax=Streptomyces sp. NPDC050703 TaxID=3157218 RepID=UPI00342E5BE1
MQLLSGDEELVRLAEETPEQVATVHTSADRGELAERRRVSRDAVDHFVARAKRHV